MSHFTVMVVGEDYAAELAPFQENNMGDCSPEYLKYKTYPKGSSEGKWFDSEEQAKSELGELFDSEEGYRENPNRKWDWYSLGGRWSNMLLLKSGKKVDTALKSEIDFEGMRAIAYTEATVRYKNIHAVIAGRPIPNWKEVLNRHPDNVDAAREDYHTNEVIKDTRKLLGFFESLSEFDCTEEEYGNRVANDSYKTLAFLQDGKWHERGEMLMFGMVANKKNPDEWEAEFDRLLADVPDNARISIVDCHI